MRTRTSMLDSYKTGIVHIPQTVQNMCHTAHWFVILPAVHSADWLAQRMCKKDPSVTQSRNCLFACLLVFPPSGSAYSYQDFDSDLLVTDIVIHHCHVIRTLCGRMFVITNFVSWYTLDSLNFVSILAKHRFTLLVAERSSYILWFRACCCDLIIQPPVS